MTGCVPTPWSGKGRTGQGEEQTSRSRAYLQLSFTDRSANDARATKLANLLDEGNIIQRASLRYDTPDRVLVTACLR